MTEVLHSSQSSSSSSLSCAPSSSSSSHEDPLRRERVEEQEREEEEVCSRVLTPENREVEIERDQLSLLALLLTLFRKSFWMASCKTNDGEEDISNGMDISWPTNVRHVAHVTFDRFNGFLGLPVEFEPEVPRRAPSASTTVFGVSTESMQLSFDKRGNSVPTILLLMQRRLYVQGGLQAEGIFRINAENSQEEFVREQLNRGLLPQGIDVHCLAGLIKAWFRELPTGILDSLSPEQVTQSQSEEECSALVALLPSTQSALLSWAVNLMADVVQMEHVNKMNAHNVAMVFAPNMTQMVDPLTALMYAVQVMNFLKSLITKTLREREEEESAIVCTEPPSDQSGNHSPSLGNLTVREEEEEEEGHQEEALYTTKQECESESSGSFISGLLLIGQSSVVKDPVNTDLHQLPDKGGKGISNLSRINSMVERNRSEAWR
ncbi:rho GTPase-activating protein 5-like [Impatiens glandulifera]|uniref:rho GTPase-activating protein 5-like n=1 Tax=Impatiens glandulifera TaxID=253017 RepID=UPI001FB13847|nr:rho GTPase-activating protein 5-like [Impatiens glandulifera]